MITFEICFSCNKYLLSIKLTVNYFQVGIEEFLKVSLILKFTKKWSTISDNNLLKILLTLTTLLTPHWRQNDFLSNSDVAAAVTYTMHNGMFSFSNLNLKRKLWKNSLIMLKFHMKKALEWLGLNMIKASPVTDTFPFIFKW